MPTDKKSEVVAKDFVAALDAKQGQAQAAIPGVVNTTAPTYGKVIKGVPLENSESMIIARHPSGSSNPRDQHDWFRRKYGDFPTDPKIQEQAKTHAENRAAYDALPETKYADYKASTGKAREFYDMKRKYEPDYHKIVSEHEAKDQIAQPAVNPAEENQKRLLNEFGKAITR